MPTALAPLATEIATLIPDVILTSLPGFDLEIPRLTDEEEIAIGREAAEEFERTNPLSDDPALNARVTRIGTAIVPFQPRPTLPFTFKVIDSPEINAFALPGGFIYITRGILDFVESDDELAGVIGHEIAHVALRHGAQQIEILAYAQAVLDGLISGNADLATIYQDHRAQFATDLVATLALNGWGRELELDADEYGTVYMAQAGYDPYAVVQLLERFAAEEKGSGDGDIFAQWMATHPPFAARIERVEFAIQEHRLGWTPKGDSLC
jgi:predicted Zn-dependent protease